MRFHCRCNRLAFFLASAICTAGADEISKNASLGELSIEELMDVEVTLASRRPERLAETAAASYVLTGEELDRLGIRSLPDALRLVPGMQVGRVDANKWVVSARGFPGLFANKLLVLIDGRTVFTPLVSGVFWESQDIVFDDVEHIEIIRGLRCTPSTVQKLR